MAYGVWWFISTTSWFISTWMNGKAVLSHKHVLHPYIVYL